MNQSDIIAPILSYDDINKRSDQSWRIKSKGEEDHQELPMRKSSIYADTSVIGGCCDREFQEWSNGLLADIKAGKFSLFLSELSDAEVQDAPEEVKKIYLEFRPVRIEYLSY
jgi:hypothetical protein